MSHVESYEGAKERFISVNAARNVCLSQCLTRHIRRIREFRACGLIHEGCLFQCNTCVSTIEERSTWREHLVLFIMGFIVWCDICGNECTGGVYLRGHTKTVHEGGVAQCTIQMCI